MKHKIIAGLLSTFMVVGLLSGCGTDEKNTTATDNKTATESSENGSKEQVKLRFMGYNAESSRATYLKLLDEKLPNIKIEFEFVSQDNFDNILNTQLQAGQGPDIMELGGQTRLLANSGNLLDLSGEEFVSKYAEAGIKPYTVDGKVWATPLQSWFEGIFYNKKIFKENNLEVPKTWDEFLNLHQKLIDKGIKPQTMGASSYEPMMKQSIGVVNNLFYSNPENKDFDEKFNKGEVELAKDWLPAVTKWHEIIDKGYLNQEMLGLSYDQALDEFATEKSAMWESGPWAVNTIMEKNPNLELGMFPIPGDDANTPGWLVGGPGSALAINAQTKHKAEALEVLNLTATDEAQKALIKDNAGSSFLKGVEADLGNTYKDCDDAFKEGHVYAPWTAVWINGNAVTEGYGKSLQEVLAKTKTVKDALDDADKINKDLLEAIKN